VPLGLLGLPFRRHATTSLSRGRKVLERTRLRRARLFRPTLPFLRAVDHGIGPQNVRPEATYCSAAAGSKGSGLVGM
jgi:hypothetical protein